MYFVLKSLKFIYIIPLYMFGHHCVHHQELLSCTSQHHTGPETACAAEKLLMMDTIVSETCTAE